MDAGRNYIVDRNAKDKIRRQFKVIKKQTYMKNLQETILFNICFETISIIKRKCREIGK